MEIKIDTQKDSKEEIKKTIEFLQKLVGSETSTDETSTESGMFDLFDNNSEDDDSEDKKFENPNKSYYEKEEEKPKDIPRVEIFD